MCSKNDDREWDSEMNEWVTLKEDSDSGMESSEEGRSTITIEGNKVKIKYSNGKEVTQYLDND